MKQTHKILFGLVIASAALMAGSVTIPNTFTANTTAKASEVNANFSAVKTAVDGNAGDIATNSSNISTLNSNKQKRVSATCAAGSSIRTINEDGTVVCETDDDAGGDITRVTAGGGLEGGGGSGDVTLTLSNARVSIHPSAWKAQDPDRCVYYTNAQYGWFDDSSSNNNCVAYGSISLPDGATIAELTCGIYNHSASDVTVKLYRAPINGGAAETIGTLVLNDNDTNVHVKGYDAFDAGVATVDNENYSYLLSFDPPGDTATANNKYRIYGCNVKYAY